MTTSRAAPSAAKRAASLHSKAARQKIPRLNNLRLGALPRLAPDVLSELRRDYEAGREPLIAVAARHGLNRPMLCRIAVAQGWRLRMTMPFRLPSQRRHDRTPRSPSPSPPPAAGLAPDETPAQGWTRQAKARPASIAALALRLHRALAREIDRIERLHLTGCEEDGASGRKSDDARTLRTLTALAETLVKVKQLRAQGSAARAEDHDDIADIDQFRCALARRIDGFVAGRADAAAAAQPRCGDAETASS